jgi:hypothetical protein
MDAIKLEREKNLKVMSLEEIKVYMAQLERTKAELIKPFYDEYEQVCKELHERLGTNAYFQDETGTVYKTVEPDGTFVRFQKYGIARTRFNGEAKGSLSMTEFRIWKRLPGISAGKFSAEQSRKNNMPVNIADRLTNADIFHLFKNGKCICGAPKYQNQAFCIGCYDELSPETKKLLSEQIGYERKRKILKHGFPVVFRKAWKERNGEI